MKTWMKVFFTLIGLAAGFAGLVLGLTALVYVLTAVIGFWAAFTVVLIIMVVGMAALIATIVRWALR